MGLAVTGSSYIIEIKMPESTRGELQRDFMFKWKMVEFSRAPWILIHKDFIPRAVVSWPGAPRDPPENMSRQVGCALPCSSGKGALPAVTLALQSRSVSRHVQFHGAGQAGWRHILHLEQKIKARFMTILAFQEHSFPSPELALERAVTCTELSLTVNTIVIPKHCSNLFSYQK